MTIDKTLAEREQRYGDFTDVATTAQALQDTMRAAPGWARLDPVQRQGLTAIADKIGRILSGDPNYPDNWHDIAGYATIVEHRLPAARPAVPAEPQWINHDGSFPPDTLGSLDMVAVRYRSGLVWDQAVVENVRWSDVTAYRVVVK